MGVTELPDRETGDGLTVRQRRVLEVIRNSVDRRGYPPSMREIGDAVGLASPSSVSHQLNGGRGRLGKPLGTSVSGGW